jgi:hypothetical protein
MDSDLKHLKFKHPFACLVAGPSQSGKTVIVREILDSGKHLIDINVDTINVLWYYGISQNFHKEKLNNINISYIEGKPEQNHFEEYKPNIIILDDLMDEVKNEENVSKIFTRESHHLNISVILITQNLFADGKKMRTNSLNSQYFLLTTNRRDLNQIAAFGRQCYPKKGDAFMNIYFDAISEPFGYLLFDCHITTPEKLRLRTKITLAESKFDDKISPVIYEICQ